MSNLNEESQTKAQPLEAQRPIRGRRLLSGIQPSGRLHLGNFYGAMAQHIETQLDNDGYFFIADYHAMTTVQDAQELRRLSLDVAMDYLAAGLDPVRAALYRQSSIPEVAELAWILSCIVSVADLERSVTYKDKVQRGLVPNTGLLTYPILMASDILIMQSEVVPVGQDQIQHIEMTRRYASRFNATFGRTILVLPQALLNEARIVPGIDGGKMSKSYNNSIPLFGEPDEVKRLLMAVKTDSLPVSAPKDPDNCNAYALLRLLANPQEAAEWEERYRSGGLAYSSVKKRLVELYEARFGEVRARRRELASRPGQVEEILSDGAQRARRISCAVMEEVRDAVGLPGRPAV